MRYLLITRGMPFCGKTSWIKKYSLENHTLDSKVFKNLLFGPSMNINGDFRFQRDGEGEAFQMLFTALESRMQRGEFIVIEDCHIKKSYFNSYKQLSTIYNYEIFIIDFTNESLDSIKQRNIENNMTYTENELQTLYKQMQENKIPIKCKIMNPNEIIKILNLEPINLNGYKAIHHIGDIHGCFFVLNKYLNNMKNDEFYIFLGDYIDRGLQNYEVIKFLLKIIDNKNVCLLEGNHEKSLWDWANDRELKLREFRLNTKVELEDKGFTKMEAKKFYSNLKPYIFYKFYDKKVFCSHGGISKIPDNPILMPTLQYIHGVGDYMQPEQITQKFTTNIKDDSYQVFGHRNKAELPICLHERNFLLESQVEFGGYLRILELNQKGFHDKSIKNTFFISRIEKQNRDKIQKYVDSMMRNSNIISSQDKELLIFNINDDINMQFALQPLIINAKSWKIVARGYDLNKKNGNLKNITYPLRIFNRIAGDYALLYCHNNNLMCFSNNQNMIERNIPTFKNSENRKNIIEFLKNKDCCLITKINKRFEVTLLDILANSLETNPHNNLDEISNKFGLKSRNLYVIIDNQKGLNSFIREINSMDTTKRDMIFGLNAIDSNQNYIYIETFLSKEFRAIEHIIRIWQIQGEHSKLKWINNSFREQFYSWFKDRAREYDMINKKVDLIKDEFISYFFKD